MSLKDVNWICRSPGRQLLNLQNAFQVIILALLFGCYYSWHAIWFRTSTKRHEYKLHCSVKSKLVECARLYCFCMEYSPMKEAIQNAGSKTKVIQGRTQGNVLIVMVLFGLKWSLFGFGFPKRLYKSMHRRFTFPGWSLCTPLRYLLRDNSVVLGVCIKIKCYCIVTPMRRATS